MGIPNLKSIYTQTDPQGPVLNIKMPSYWYRKSNDGDKRILQSSYIYTGNSDADKIPLDIESGPRFLWMILEDSPLFNQ